MTVSVTSDPTIICRGTWKGPEAQAQAAVLPPFGPGFSPAIAAQTKRLELWVTTFAHPGDDWVEFRAWHDATLIATQRFAGY